MLARVLTKLSRVPKLSPNFSPQACLIYDDPYSKNPKKEDRSRFSKTDNDDLSDHFNTPSPMNILSFLEENKDDLKSKDLHYAIGNFLKIYKQALTEPNVDKSNIWNQLGSLDSFEKTMNPHIDKLSNSDLIYFLQVLLKMKIPSSSKIFCSALQSLLQSVDKFSITDYSTVSRIINRIPSSPLTLKLRTVMKQKFIVKVSMNLDKKNIDHLTSGLVFAAQNSCNNLFKIFLTHFENFQDDIPLESANLIMEAILKAKVPSNDIVKALKKTENAIINHSDELNMGQVNFITHLLDIKLKNTKDEVFYNPHFLDLMAKKFIQNDWGFEGTLSAIRNLTNMRHYNKELVNYGCATYFEKRTMKQEYIGSEIKKLFVLITGLSLGSHKTIFWIDIEKSLKEAKLLESFDDETLCILLANMLSLDSYPEYLLKTFFDEERNYNQNEFLLWTFTKIYQKLKTNKNYNGPLPSDQQMKHLEFHNDDMIKKVKNRHNRLYPYLEEGLGGSKFIKSGVKTKLFHVIEHVVAFQANPTLDPWDINQNNDGDVYLEDLQVPEGCKIVPIITVSDQWYTRNTNELLGLHRIEIDSLRAMSYPVVVIKRTSWKKMPLAEKTSFLMEQIKAVL
ncbi:hypothetical protein TKK_0006764 [Trichogramma kaykai]|uniref:RAP domain-containing protein n=1 Tax=Trichogramma kaykai TaxID=54128 RepID=A0ABD2XD73_9HYME